MKNKTNPKKSKLGLHMLQMDTYYYIKSCGKLSTSVTSVKYIYKHCYRWSGYGCNLMIVLCQRMFRIWFYTNTLEDFRHVHSY